MATQLLQLSDVWYAYPGAAPVLQGISLQIAAGEWLGITGVGGAGKSTLGRLCAGLLRPQRGAVTGPAAGMVAVVPQDPQNALLGSSVAQDAAFAPARMGMSGPLLQAWVQECLAQVGLGPDILRRDPRKLSGGEQQRVVIAAALAGRPKLVVLDEPAAMLDNAARDTLLKTIDRLRQEHSVAFLHISHDLDELAGVDRLAVLADGKVVVAGAWPQVLDDPAVPAAIAARAPALCCLDRELRRRQIYLAPASPTVPAWVAVLQAEKERQLC